MQDGQYDNRYNQQINEDHQYYAANKGNQNQMMGDGYHYTGLQQINEQ